MEFTIDQTAIINSTKNQIVQTYSGTGKTETIIGAVIKNKKKNTLLLVSSELSRQRYIKRFECDCVDNVRVETAFSLAWKKIGHKKISVKKNGYTPFEIKNILNINSSNPVYDLQLAHFIKRMSICRCGSSTDSEARKRFLKSLYQEEEITFFWGNEGKLIDYTNAFMDLMHRWVIPCIPEYCLNMFCLSEPTFRSNFIVVEDAANTPHILLELVKRQKALKFIFGDEHQKLTACNNWLSIFQDSFYSTRCLSNSFLTSSDVTNQINEVLSWKKYLYENFSFPELSGIESNGNIKTHAFIGKDRITTLNKAIELYDQDDSISIYFEKGFNYYLETEEGISLKDILHLYTDEHSRIDHPLIRWIESIDLLEQYAAIIKDRNLHGFIQLVKKHRKGLPDIVKSLFKAQHKNKRAKKSTVNFSAYGLKDTYDEVTLLDDFINHQKIVSVTQSNQTIDFFQVESEINQLYTTASRAVFKLNLTDLPIEKSTKPEVVTQKKQHPSIKKAEPGEFSENDRRELIYNLDRTKKNHQNIFNKWTKEQDQYLVNMHDKDKSLADIAHSLKRTKSAVSSRLRKLNENE